MTSAIAVKGTALKIGQGDTVPGPETFTLIAEILNISGPNETVGTIDATSMDSTAKEYISTALPDGGEVSFECHFIGTSAQQQGLRTDARAGTLRNFELVIPDGSEVAFSAFVTAIGPEFPAEGKVTQNVTLKLSGVPTWTYAS